MMNKIEIHKELRIESQMRNDKAKEFASDNFSLKSDGGTIAIYDPTHEKFYFPCVTHLDESVDESGTHVHCIPTPYVQKIAKWIDDLFCDPDERYKPVTDPDGG